MTKDGGWNERSDDCRSGTAEIIPLERLSTVTADVDVDDVSFFLAACVIGMTSAVDRSCWLAVITIARTSFVNCCTPFITCWSSDAWCCFTYSTSATIDVIGGNDAMMLVDGVDVGGADVIPCCSITRYKRFSVRLVLSAHSSAILLKNSCWRMAASCCLIFASCRRTTSSIVSNRCDTALFLLRRDKATQKRSYSTRSPIFLLELDDRRRCLRRRGWSSGGHWRDVMVVTQTSSAEWNHSPERATCWPLASADVIDVRPIDRRSSRSSAMSCVDANELLLNCNHSLCNDDFVQLLCHLQLTSRELKLVLVAEKMAAALVLTRMCQQQRSRHLLSYKWA